MVIKDFDEIYGIEIPDSWNVEKIEPKVGNVKSGKRLPKGFYVTDMHTSHPYIRVIDMREGYVDTSELKYVPDEAFSAIQNYRIYKDDIYISVAGTLGIVGQIPAYLDGANLTENANRVTNIKCNVKYLMYWLMSSTIQNIISQTQTLGAQPKLALTRIRNFPVILPSIQEQKKIVEVLSDVDTLIADLQKLIRKKKNIRQGTMQMLLSGKHRLDGYSSSWRTSELSKVTSRVGVGLATSVTQYYRDSGTIIFRNLNIKENYLDDTDVLYLEEEFASRNPNKAIHKGDVLTVHTGYVGISCVVPEKYDGALTFTTLITTTNKKELLPEYLSYHLNSSLGHRVIEDLQTSGGRKNLNVSDFEKYTLTFPKDINEQRAIVSVLADMDVEIRKLEEKLSKYQKIKQGMMEELLTGKVRLM